MTQRTALVTGGGAGMGAAISQRLARDGLKVCVLDIDAEAAEAVAGTINKDGGTALALTADITERSQIETVVESVREQLGPITILVNNAGIAGFSPFEDIADDSWDQMMRTNLKGAYIVTQTVLPDMKAANWGRIVNLSSVAAQSGAAKMAHYASAKAGITALTKSLAAELGALGITANAIAPGLIQTQMAQSSVDKGHFSRPLEEIAQHYPIPRIGQPHEVAAACAYFVSEDAGYTTGQLLGINGGTFM